MYHLPGPTELFVTFYTISFGVVGATIAYTLGFPVFLLTGPALFVSLIGLVGVKLGITPVVRDLAFLFIGIGIGSGVDSQATDAILRWPLAFLGLGAMLWAAMLLGRKVLNSCFGFDDRTAILAATPGHLSYIISLSESLNINVAKVAVTQSIRVLALTLCVPFVAMAYGIDVSSTFQRAGQTMGVSHVIAVFASSLALGLILKRFNLPAALLIGAMIISGSSHLTGLAPGVLSPYITQACFLIMGTLIGTRFSGITAASLKNSFLAGLAVTGLTVLLALVAAIPAAALVDMPVAHVVIAFAPGGLETMIVMGAVLGANPGFVAACHVGRLLILTFLVPAALALSDRNK